MRRSAILALMLAAAVAAPVAAQPRAAAETCAAQLKSSRAAEAVTAVKLEEETERADAQTYLTRLELQITKQRLAAALAKCGAACAPPTPAATAPGAPPRS